jgi:hypothetical protein
MSANPKRISSSGAAAILTPIMAPLRYITILRDVSHQFVSNWNGKMIAYEAQNARLLSSPIFVILRSKKILAATNAIAVKV